TGSLPFYAVTPCRLVDTRSDGSGSYGSGETRVYDFSTNANCTGLPSTAQAWSLNISMQVVSHQAYLTAWPDGESQPLVSTLVAYATGLFYTNAAIVPTGNGDRIDVYCQYAAQVVIDVNGYYEPGSALVLPYAGVGSSAGGTDLFSIQNTGSGRAIHGISNSGAALQADSTASGFGIVANTTGSGTAGYFSGAFGIAAYGSLGGSRFADSTSSWTGWARLGAPGHGVEAYGLGYGGYFADNVSGPTGSAKLGAYTIGGDFLGATYAVRGSAGSGTAGYFNGYHGVEAYGTQYGVYATAVVAASGVAGYFNGYDGVIAYGPTYGGYFVGTGTGVGIYATAASGQAGWFTGANGIQAWGTTAGGYGVYGYNSNTGTYSYLGKGTTKVTGIGSVSFVQNHPYDPTRVIVYSAPESD